MSSVQVSGNLRGTQHGAVLETNLRLVGGGDDGFLGCRRVIVESADRGVDLRHKVCSKLRARGSLAVPSLQDPQEILVTSAHHKSIPAELSGEDWHARLRPADEEIQLRFGKDQDARTIAEFVQKGLVLGFEKAGEFWRTGDSPRYWYGHSAIAVEDGVAMYRGASFASQVLSDGRVGVAIDVRHLFLSEANLADVAREQGLHGGLRQRFDVLRRRSEGGRGSLVYDSGTAQRSKCFLHEFSDTTTCGTTGAFSIGTENFGSLYEYYQRRRPKLGVHRDDTVVYVRFPGLDRPKPVAAKLLRLRVSLDPRQMPRRLRRLAMAPADRKQAVMATWDKVAEGAVARSGCSVASGFWLPKAGEEEQLPCPDLIFGKGRRVAAPRFATEKEYRRYFAERLTKLNDGGLYHFEHSVGTGLWIVTPPAGGDWSEQIHDQFLQDFTNCLERISGQTFRVQVLREGDCERVAARLGQAEPSTAVIAFDERQADGAAYFLLSHALRDWRLKRVTRRVLQRTWQAIRDARGTDERQRCQREWNDVILHCVLKTLTQMDAVPWRLASWPYDACLVIDVSDGRKFFALSFLLCRDESQRPGFWQYGDAWPKPDPNHDAINGVVLQDRVAKLLDSYAGSSFAPIRSLLVLRDGRTGPGEESAVRHGLERWRSSGQLLPDATIDFVDVHKRSVKDLRMWQAGVETLNVLEGRAIFLDRQSALVSCTGAATLPRGATAEPSLLIGRLGVDMRRASSAVFALAQMNFASPKKAHRDPQPLRVADAVLKDRMAVETRGLR